MRSLPQTITTRRAALQLIAAAASASTAGVWPESAKAAASLAIDAVRLRQSLEGLSLFGRPPGGSFADGITRQAYSTADVAGRAFAMDLMRQAGLDPRIDAAGNISGLRPGSDSRLKPILMGSHIDSVPKGGNFDGPVGAMAAIEVARTLKQHRVPTRHPVEVTIWANEEGSPMGSALATGEPLGALGDPATPAGQAARAGLARIGGNPDAITSAVRAPGSIRCYLELHVEQGGILDRDGVPVGVVDGIVGID